MIPSLNDIFGQDGAIETLRRAYRSGRMPHGLIFAGPVGVGKATTARALAALFLCEKPKSDTPCAKCESCKLFAADAHPDFHVITKELIRVHDKTGKSKGIDLSIHVIEGELVDKDARTSALNLGKVFVVEQAELMNALAQNSMLKTLEEPTGRTLIILLTDQPGVLLPTIRSRCQIVRFGELDPKVVRDKLAQRGIDPGSADRASRLAHGSLGCALRWLAEGVVDAAESLADRLVSIERTGSSGDLPEFLRKAADAYAEIQLKRDPLSSKEQATREALGLYFRLAAEHFRSRLADDVDDDARERFCDSIEAIVQAEVNLDANVTISLLLQQLAASLADDVYQHSLHLTRLKPHLPSHRSD